MTQIFETYSPEETRALGKTLGEQAFPGEIICLNGELGVGKTVLTKGFAEGLGVAEPVTSPTFTMIQEYKSGRLPLYHFDVYRIGDPEEMDELGYEEYFFGEGVTMIEWSTLISELIPMSARKILIEKDSEKNEDYRRITIVDLEKEERSIRGGEL